MDEPKVCLVCQDFESNIGHETKWCPKIKCKKCGKNGHTKVNCMINMENLPLPNEVMFKILGYLNLKDLGQFGRVSKRTRDICQSLKLFAMEKMGFGKDSLGYKMGFGIDSLSCKFCTESTKNNEYFNCTQCRDIILCDICYSNDLKYEKMSICLSPCGGKKGMYLLNGQVL